MTRTTFAQVKAALNSDNGSPILICIASPYNRPCETEIDPDQLVIARQIILRAQFELTLEEIRDLICCLLCENHQRTYTHKRKAEEAWRHDFPHIDFSARRHRSPYSLVGGRRSASKNAPWSGMPTPPPSHERRSSDLDMGRSMAERLGPPPAQPDFERGRSFSAPSTSLASQALQSGRHNENTPSEGHRAASDRPSPPDSPLAGRDSNDDIRPQEAHIEGAASGVEILVIPDAEDNAPTTAELPSQTPPAAEDAIMANGPDHTPTSAEVPQFIPGAGSVSAPWTLRSRVLDLVLEPLPKADSRGSIYAVQSSEDASIVKIGITTDKIEKRFSNIRNQHGHGLRTESGYHLTNIPYLQLKRLEAIVHADLGFFQRKLRNKRTTGPRYPREYFEVDLATAERTINQWWERMQSVGLAPGHPLDPELVKSIQSNRALRVETNERGAAVGAQVWAELNADHSRREAIWEDVFPRPTAEAKRSADASSLLWMLMTGALLLILDTLGFNVNNAFRVALAILAVLKSFKVL